MNRVKIISGFLFLVLYVHTKASNPKYFIRFTDRNGSPFSIQHPELFLSQRAIDRRVRQQISISENDLPVNPSYIDSVASKGAIIFTHSKWLNGITVSCDSVTLQSILTLPFVQNATRVYRTVPPKKKLKDKLENTVPLNLAHTLLRIQGYNYGSAYNQIHLMNGDFLHSNGFTGTGMQLALLDDGFYEVDQLPAFNTLRSEQRILGTWDFVNDEPGVYEDDSHGMSVLSTIAGNIPGELVGTAPGISVWLLRTEDAYHETIIEEYNWAAAAEFADSVGADVISSSLGYSTFDDSTMDHSYSDIDGNTCPSSLAADIAASKGLLVLVSAGNQGNTAWHYISAPSDGDSVLCVGSVDSLGHKSSFSSFGPSADGDIKPNVAAKGSRTTISYSDGSIGQANGTSFSCPVLAGAAACFWQAYPSKTNMEIFHAIEESANYFHSPGDSLGYGIPDFRYADELLGGAISHMPKEDNILSIYPNPFINNFELRYFSMSSQYIDIEITDAIGQRVYFSKPFVPGGITTTFQFNDLEKFRNGVYMLRVQSGDKTSFGKMIKL